MARLTYEKFEESFWGRVARGASEECWLWTSTLDKDGYGFCAVPGHLVGREGKRLNTRASRVAFWLVHGRWPEPWALHGCDNPPCCNAENPDHVHEGTCSLNTQEAFLRGRRVNPLEGRHGEAHPQALLTDAQALELRRRVAAGERQTVVAAAFGIDKDTAWSIVRGRTYRSEAAGWYPGYAPARQDYRTVLTLDQVREIRRRYAEGALHRELAEEFGLSPSGVSRITRREVYRDLD